MDPRGHPRSSKAWHEFKCSRLSNIGRFAGKSLMLRLHRTEGRSALTFVIANGEDA
jgi:hypothetical protein